MSSGSNPMMNAFMSQLQAGSNPGRPRQPTRTAPQPGSRIAPMKPVYVYLQASSRLLRGYTVCFYLVADDKGESIVNVHTKSNSCLQINMI